MSITPLNLAYIIGALVLIFIVLPKISKARKNKLHKAASKNDTKTIERLLSQGWDIHTLDRFGRTPLNVAITSHAYDSIKTLLDRGANIHRVDEYGFTALHTASYGEDVEVVKLLVGRGAKVTAKDVEGYTPLHYACEDDDNLEIVKFLVKMHANIDARNNIGETALHIAAIESSQEIMTYLLTQKVDLSLKDNEGFTARQRVDEELEYLFFSPEEKKETNDGLPRYEELADTTGFLSNFWLVVGLILTLIGWGVYRYENNIFGVFFLVLFGGIGLWILVNILLDKISLNKFGPIPIFIDNHTTSVGATLKGYVIVTPELEEREILFSLFHKRHTTSRDSDGKTSSHTRVLWKAHTIGKLGLMESKKVIHFEIPIKSGLSKTRDTYGWSLTLKPKSNVYLPSRSYGIVIR